MITDQFNRIHNYLRISLTDNCNLRCFYCMPDEEYEFTPASRLMQHDEIVSLAKIFVQQGITKIRLTGGEPLVRKDAGRIITSLARLPVELVITTNGTRLQDFIDILEAANVGKLNISLDTLKPDKFLLITRRDQHGLVIRNIETLIAKGFSIKINVVLMKGINDDEILDFINWTKDQPIEVRFIEFMPFSGNKWTANKVFSLAELLAVVSSRYSFEPLPGTANDTAVHYNVPGFKGSFAVISSMTAPFCGTCNRLRLTADGKLKNCLFSKGETDLLTALRNNQDIVPLIHQNVQRKAKELGGQFTAVLEDMQLAGIDNRSMITIGG